MTGAVQSGSFVPYGDLGVQYSKAEEGEDFSEVMKAKPEVEMKPKDAPGAMEELFTDPLKMLGMWLKGEMQPNIFASEQKDPMESFGKFIQAMSMQTQTNALKKLEATMVNNNKFAAKDLMGNIVEFESDKLTITPGRKITESFEVPDKTDAFLVEVKDTSGDVVYQSMAYNPGIGINKIEWAGIDNDGKEVPTGDYTLSVELLKKESVADGPPKFERFEYAKDLDGKDIHNKPHNLSIIDREVQFSYEIPKGMPDLEYASVRIINSKGMSVHKGEIEVTSGKKGVYSWNCLDGAGNRAPEDEYTIQISLKDKNRKILKTDKQPIIRVSGKVKGVEVSDAAEANIVTSRIKAPVSTVKSIIDESGL